MSLAAGATLTLDPGFSIVGSVHGGGANATIELAKGKDAGTLAALDTSLGNFGNLVFDAGAVWTVTIAKPAAFTDTISGFAEGDLIDLMGTAATGAAYSGGKLTLTHAGRTVATLNVTGDYTTAQFVLTRDGHGGTDITLRPPAPSELSFAVAADKGSAGDTFTVSGKGEAGDRVTLFDGKTEIGSDKVGAGGAWSITTATPLAIGAHSLTASEVDIAGSTSALSPAQRLVIAHAAANAVTFFGSAGIDHFTGGAGNDLFRFSAAELGNTDIVEGGAGNDQLELISAGTVDADGVSGVETYVLFNGAGNVLSLVNANFTGVTGSTITVDGGNAGNTLSEAGVSALDHAVLNGGAGADTLIAGRNAMLKGGAGKDVFELTVPGSTATPDTNTIADFNHGTDKIAFSEKGFGLGSAPVAASLFTTGSFTNASQRFAYDTTTGDLFYDGRGNAAGSTPLEIAILTNHAMLTASDIAFVV